MRIRKVLTAVTLSLPLLVALPGEASAQCINGVNASALGEASQTNTCTTTAGTPTTP